MSGAAPRALFVGGTAYELPLAPAIARKWDAVDEHFEVRVIAQADGGRGSDPRFRLLRAPLGRLRGPSFLGALPFVVAMEGRRFRPDVVIAQSPYEAVAALPGLRLLRPRPQLLVEVHGDPRTATRLYGSRLRRIYTRVVDRAAVVGLRRADATRAISSFTAGIVEDVTGRAPTGVFPTYFDLESFLRDPPCALPERPQAAWIGALQRTKNPGLLVDAWRQVAERIPAARLVIVGDGPLRSKVEALAKEFPHTVDLHPRLAPLEVARVLDDSTLLALSSESEGLGRVILEAFTRGRAVVSTDVGGIPDLVRPDRNGLLVPSGDPEALADALVRVLGDRSYAERLGSAAAEDAQRVRWTAERYASALRELVDGVLSRA